MTNTRKRKVGRPPTPAAVRLDALMTIRLTKIERKRVMASARERGVTASTVVRDALARAWKGGE